MAESESKPPDFAGCTSPTGSDSGPKPPPTGAADDKADTPTRRHWPRVMAAAALLMLLAYVASYFCVRTFSIIRSGETIVVGMAGFEYSGDAHAYALSKEDAFNLFLTERIIPELARSLLDHPPRDGGGDAPSFWVVYVPLERIELWCRDVTPVFLTEQEEASLLAKCKSMKLPY